MGGTEVLGRPVGSRSMFASRVGRAYGQVLVASAAMLTFIAATNRWVSWNTAIYKFRSFDDLSYRAMASAAPGLLHTRIPEWHAERFAVEWVIGSAAKLFGISIEAAFWATTTIVILTTCLVIVDLLVRIELSVPAAILCMGTFVLNTYAIRPYLIGPGGVSDLVFVLAVAISVRGLVLRQSGVLLGGLLLGTIARQTMLPAASAAGGAVLLDPTWRVCLGRSRWPFAASLVLFPLTCYAVIRIVAHGFSGPSPALTTMTLLGASISPAVLLPHFGRCVIGFLLVGALLAALWWVRRRPRADDHLETSSTSAMRAVYACLAFGAAIVIQPVVLNPDWAVYNETRLSVLGLVPFVVALALMIREFELNRTRSLSPRVVIPLVGLLAIGSLHHIDSLIGPANKAQTVVLQIFVALAAWIVMLRWSSRARVAV